MNSLAEACQWFDRVAGAEWRPFAALVRALEDVEFTKAMRGPSRGPDDPRTVTLIREVRWRRAAHAAETPPPHPEDRGVRPRPARRVESREATLALRRQQRAARKPKDRDAEIDAAIARSIARLEAKALGQPEGGHDVR